MVKQYCITYCIYLGVLINKITYGKFDHTTSFAKSYQLVRFLTHIRQITNCFISSTNCNHICAPLPGVVCTSVPSGGRDKSMTTGLIKGRGDPLPGLRGEPAGNQSSHVIKHASALGCMRADDSLSYPADGWETVANIYYAHV